MSRQILYVDDEPYFVEALVDALKDEGYSVATATDGAQAVDFIMNAIQTNTVPDLVILDVIMPVGKDGKNDFPQGNIRRTGLRVFEIIRTRLKLTMPIIFVTVVADLSMASAVSQIEKSVGLNACSILSKPAPSN